MPHCLCQPKGVNVVEIRGEKAVEQALIIFEHGIKGEKRDRMAR